MLLLFQKGEGDPNFENFKKGVEPKKNLGWGNQKEGDFKKERENQTFQIESRDRKDKNGDFFRQLSINFYKIFTCSSKHHILFDHLLCILCLNDSKEYSYSAIYIKDNNISNLVHKKCQKVQKGNQFFKFTSSGFGKKGGTKIFSKILGGEPKSYTLC